MSAPGSFKIWCLTDKRPCDHPSHRVLTAENLSGDPTVFIQLLHRNDLLMSCNLEDAVCRSINNEIPCFYVLFSVIPDHFRTGIRFVAKHASSCLFPEWL